MHIALGLGLSRPPDETADRLLATAISIGERCAALGWSLWLRSWSSGVACNAWVVSAALLEKIPSLQVGIVAIFPPVTRVSDIEDLLVLDNLSSGRTELAFAQETEPAAITEVMTALNGGMIKRPDPSGTLHEFPLTPVPVHGTIPSWLPLQGTGVPAGSSAAWQLETDAGKRAALFPIDNFLRSGAGTSASSDVRHVLEVGPDSKLVDFTQVKRLAQGS